MFYPLIALLLTSSSLIADRLNQDLPVLWPTDCATCEEDACFEVPCKNEHAPAFVARLKNPLYRDGVMKCTDGGVLEGPDMRIQAQSIYYTRQGESGCLKHTVYCEERILIQYYGWIISADTFFYDFNTQKGYALNAHTTQYPWFVSSEKMEFLPGGKIASFETRLTTMEGKGKEDQLSLYAHNLNLYPHRAISASNLQMRFMKFPVMWLPYLRMNLSKKERSAFAVKFGWGRFMGPHVSLLYKFLDYSDFKGFFRLDGFTDFGIGAGIDTSYNPGNNDRELYTRNYYAPRLQIDNPFTRNRYRFQGIFKDKLLSKKLTLKGQYDYVSDAQMAYQYRTQDFDLKTAGATQFHLRHQAETWIGNLFARVRVNDFQSISQHLPTIHYNLHPFTIPYTGIIAESNINASYFNFLFSNEVIARSGFQSARIEARPRLYRPIHLSHATITPSAGYTGIYYSDSQSSTPVGQSLANIGCRFSTKFHHKSDLSKNVFEPYADYFLYTTPKTAVGNYYVFSINDGYNALNQLRFGLRHSIFYKSHWGIKEILSWDIFANAFFDNAIIPKTLPIGYLNADFFPMPFLKGNIRSSWNFAFQQLDYFNIMADWTINDHIAFSLGYQTRGPYYVRKCDFYNFMVNVTRTPDELLDSALSDKRDTLVATAFIRPVPGFTFKTDVRTGWGRPNQRPFFEYELDLGTVLFDHLRFHFLVKKKMADIRYAFSLKLDPQRSYKG